jgi:putative tryptophan/tyrosine transport system substrate-binding protein
VSTPTRVGRIEVSFALLVVGLCGFAASLAGCSIGAAQPRREIAFINFDNERARFAFERFVAACEALGIQERHRVVLVYSGVDVMDEMALRSVLQREIAKGPAAIVAPTSPVLVEAARLTAAIPIVFFTHQDPVDLNLAASLVQRPRNLAGISLELGVEAKMLELLREAAPRARSIGYIFDYDEAPRPSVEEFLEASARRHGIRWKLVPVKSIETLAGDIRGAGPVDAWFVTKAGVLDEHGPRFVATVAATRLPAIYPSQFEVAEGAPMAYEAVFDDPNGALARQLDRALSGVTPRDIPVERPTRFSLSVNVGAARAAGMTMSPELLSRADAVR